MVGGDPQIDPQKPETSRAHEGMRPYGEKGYV